MKNAFFYVLFYLLLTIVLAPAWANILHVPSEYSSIQSAVDSSQSGDTVLIANGTYFEQTVIANKTVMIGGRFLLTHDSLDISATTITIPDSIRYYDGVNRSVISVLPNSVVWLNGITVRGGYGYRQYNPVVNTYGGSIFADTCSIFIDHCHIIHGTAYGGGGFGSYFCRWVSVNHSRVDSCYGTNAGYGGGGMDIQNCDSCRVENSTIVNNYHVGWAGGFGIGANQFGYVNNCIISNNIAVQGWGGGIFENVGTVSNCVVDGNLSASEAGIVVACYTGSPVISGEISGNVFRNNRKTMSATHLPGASALSLTSYSSGTWLIENNTFENNIDSNVYAEAVLEVQRANVLVKRNRFIGNTSIRWAVFYGFNAAHPTFDSNFVMNNIGNSLFASYTSTSPMVFTHNDFILNRGLAIKSLDGYPTAISAQYNYWGDPSGPSSSTNLTGLGDTLPDYVTYLPFLTAPLFPDAAPDEGKETRLLPKTAHLLNVHPNPFNATLTIDFIVNKMTVLDLSIFDVTGRFVTQLSNRKYSTGTHSISYNSKFLPSGVYFIRMSSHNNIETNKVVLLK